MVVQARSMSQGAAPAELVERLGKLAIATLSDAQGSWGVMHPRIRSIVPGLRLLGTAHTAHCYPGSIITVHKALLEARPGEVLVVDGEGDERGALFGELMTLQAQANGIAGIVVDGPVRDAPGLVAAGFPTFATGIMPRVGTNRRVGETQVPIQCGGVVVRPGDYILADDAGVIVIPAERLAQVVEAAEGVVRKEAGIREGIAAGRQLGEMLGFTKLIYGG